MSRDTVKRCARTTYPWLKNMILVIPDSAGEAGMSAFWSKVQSFGFAAYTITTSDGKAAETGGYSPRVSVMRPGEVLEL